MYKFKLSKSHKQAEAKMHFVNLQKHKLPYVPQQVLLFFIPTNNF